MQMRKVFVLLSALALGLSVLGLAQYGYGAKENYTVLIAYKEGLGFYLTDGKGMTLYVFSKDVAGESACMGACLEKWPPFYAEKIVAPPGIDPADFGTITRPDGTKQTTYKGWPLYYFFKDEAPGDTYGEGVKNVWFVAKVPFYTVMIGYKEGIGTYLVDGKGMTLYYFVKDSPGKSVCVGECLKKWPAFYTEELILPSALSAKDFGVITRPDGTEQLTFRGWPLYYFFKDEARGDTNGQGVKGVWYVIDPFTFGK